MKNKKRYRKKFYNYLSFYYNRKSIYLYSFNNEDIFYIF